MVSDDFRVEVIGHACLRVQARGYTLLTDPWLVGTIGSNLAGLFPPPAHDPVTVAAETDAIFLSHDHPDHLNPATLTLFRKDTPVYIGRHDHPGLRDAVRALGFDPIEVPFGRAIGVAGTPFEIVVVQHEETERDAFDSALVVRAPQFTLFENNDCHLGVETLARVGAEHRPDYAFLGYSPASFFPINFELDAAERERWLADAAERKYAAFVAAARAIQARLTVPFASSMRFLRTDALWKNVLFNSATEALTRVEDAGLRGAVMGPGDRITRDGAVIAASMPLDRAEELVAIAAHASQEQPRLLAAVPAESPVHDDLVDRLCRHVLACWAATLAKDPEAERPLIAYRITGAVAVECYFDFRRPPNDVFQMGRPLAYDMRYSYSASQLQQVLDGITDWEALHFLGDVSIHQVRYASGFDRMLRAGRRLP